MRLPDDTAVDVIHAALRAGATLLDTAHAYGNEARVAEAVRTWPGPRPRVVTKGGMQPGWKPDGRASTLERQFTESLEKLGRIDLYLLHAPDPKVPLSTSVRALAKLDVPIGLSNVSLPQLQQARELAQIAAVQIALGPFHDAPFRDGLVAYCLREGIEVLAHTPLGGTKRARSLSRRPELRLREGVSPERLVLSWLCDLGIVPLPGARRVETASQIGPVPLDDADRAALDAAFPAAARALRPKAKAPLRDDGEVVLIAGIQGAGKSTHARALVEQGYQRLNRDALGGTLKGLAQRLDEALKDGARRVVLDNTYVTRASRDRVIEIAHAHALPVRCIWLETPIADAQINVIERMLEKTGTLEDPGGLLPTSQLRTLREVEAPSDEEGFSAIEHPPFVRAPRAGQPGQIVAVDQISSVQLQAGMPTLFVGWRTSVSDARGEVATCPHDAGPPKCWCRPPLPGLVLAWARRRGIDLSRSTFHAGTTAMKQMARALGCTLLDPT